MRSVWNGGWPTYSTRSSPAVTTTWSRAAVDASAAWIPSRSVASAASATTSSASSVETRDDVSFFFSLSFPGADAFAFAAAFESSASRALRSSSFLVSAAFSASAKRARASPTFLDASGPFAVASLSATLR